MKNGFIMINMEWENIHYVPVNLFDFINDYISLFIVLKDIIMIKKDQYI